MKPLANHLSFWDDAVYICTTDIEQKKKKTITGYDGNPLEIYIGADANMNHREAHPNVGVIEYASEGAEFKVGDGVVVKHFTFEDQDRNKKVLYEEGGKEYYKVNNFDLMFAIVDGELIPRKNTLLCEPVYDKFLETELQLTTEYEGSRRDLVKVLKTWNGCDLLSQGDYIIIEKNADYIFEYEGKEYISVDHEFGDVLMKVPNTEWRKKEVHTHSKDHHTSINPMDKDRYKND